MIREEPLVLAIPVEGESKFTKTEPSRRGILPSTPPDKFFFARKVIKKEPEPEKKRPPIKTVSRNKRRVGGTTERGVQLRDATEVEEEGKEGTKSLGYWGAKRRGRKER